MPPVALGQPGPSSLSIPSVPWSKDATQFPPTSSILFRDEEGEDELEPRDEEPQPSPSIASDASLFLQSGLTRAEFRARERQLVGSLTTSYKFKDGGLIKKVRLSLFPSFLCHTCLSRRRSAA